MRREKAHPPPALPGDIEAVVIAAAIPILARLTGRALERVLSYLARRFVPNCVGLSIAVPGHPAYDPPAYPPVPAYLEPERNDPDDDE